ncbi:hypothetical protein FIM12_03175 [SAR202 cluster bacterium AD-804-J14_MRT_500m]|nr:hypothetical protein [SAR202 cluster bacterium AD-804-J14_MRT_500m]
MTTVRLIRELENIDSQLMEANESLVGINATFEDRTAVLLQEEKVDVGQGRLNVAKRDNQTLEQEAESISAKLEEVESKLYGGSVSSPRELEDLTKELQHLRKRFNGIQEEVLESMLAMEEIQEVLKQDEQVLKNELEGWDLTQIKLAADKQELEQDQLNLEIQRENVIDHMEEETLRVYERIKRGKGGVVAAKMERGMCRSCGVSLPTHLVQRARSGKEIVPCPSCGKILYTE